jgi:hypothetical protein
MEVRIMTNTRLFWFAAGIGTVILWQRVIQPRIGSK